jgi:N-methylhydantoinase B
MAGGGGWGSPFERDPDAVASDVRNEKVSVRSAREHYGVVVSKSGRIDVGETRRLRSNHAGT